MSKHSKALKLALEALAASDDFLFNYHDCEPNNEREVDAYSEVRGNNMKAWEAIREALAEQTALLAANKDLQNHFDALMNDYKKLSALCSSQGTRLMEYESSHEPESKPWVGLTRDERMDIINRFAGQDWVYAVEAIEAKLREKNTPQQSKGDA